MKVERRLDLVFAVNQIIDEFDDETLIRILRAIEPAIVWWGWENIRGSEEGVDDEALRTAVMQMGTLGQALEERLGGMHSQAIRAAELGFFQRPKAAHERAVGGEAQNAIVPPVGDPDATLVVHSDVGGLA